MVRFRSRSPNASQANCEADKYKSAEGPSTCANCPLATSSAQASDELSDCKCDISQTGPDNSASCQPCNAGKYKALIGATACTDCPTGSTTSTTGSTSVSACNCRAGSTGPDASSCTSCAAGTYKSSIESETCSTCPTDSISATSSSSADDCECNAGYTLQVSNDAYPTRLIVFWDKYLCKITVTTAQGNIVQGGPGGTPQVFDIAAVEYLVKAMYKPFIETRFGPYLRYYLALITSTGRRLDFIGTRYDNINEHWLTGTLR